MEDEDMYEILFNVEPWIPIYITIIIFILWNLLFVDKNCFVCYLGTVIQNEDCSAHYQSFSFGGWYFSNGKIKIELTVVWTFQAQDVWFEFSKLLIRNSRKYVLRTNWLKIGQDEEMAALAFIDHRWNQTGKSH